MVVELFPHKEVTGEVFHSPKVEVLLDQSELLLVQSDDVHEDVAPVADQVEDGKTPHRPAVEGLLMLNK